MDKKRQSEETPKLAPSAPMVQPLPAARLHPGSTHSYKRTTQVNSRFVGSEHEAVRGVFESQKLCEERKGLLEMAAHELCQPIATILTCGEVLINEVGGTMNSEQRELLYSIRSSCESMLRLLADVVDLSAIEAGRSELPVESVDLLSVLEQSVQVCRAAAARKQIDLDLHCELPLPAVNVERTGMLRVFDTLIGNSIKYCRAGSRISVGASLEGGRALVVVQDNGPGIPGDEIAHLFKPFQKTRAQAAAAQPGSGLELAIVGRIVERHGGQVWAKSIAGQGVAFYVSLPAGSARGGSRVA